MLPNDFEKTCEQILKGSILYINKNLVSLGKEKIKIDYEISNSEKFQGRSNYNNGKYKIFINQGVFEKIYIYFDSLLSEINNKENNGLYYKTSNEYIYNEEKASLYKYLMFFCSVKIIIYHELGHIVNGHLKYSNKNSKDNIIDKSFYINNIDKEQLLPPIEKQLLELDADCFAATSLIGNYTFDETIFNFNNFFIDKGTSLLKNKEHSLMILIISSIITFAIMGMGEERKNKRLNELNYLPHRIRLHYYIRVLFTAYEGINNEKLKGDLFKIDFIEEIIPNIEEYVYKLNKTMKIFKKESIVNNLNELNDDHKKYCNFLDKYWTNEFRSKLQDFSVIPLAL